MQLYLHAVMADAPGRLPLLPLATSHVDGAGAVLHSLPTGQHRRVVITLGGLGSTKEPRS